MENIIQQVLKESNRVSETFIRDNGSTLAALAEKIASTFLRDGKLLICGNGGSAADAQHMAAEFVNRFQIERPPLPALALTTDTSVITSIGNDYSFEDIFAKQVKALGVEGDILLTITTSGSSLNLVSAVKSARKKGLFTAGLLGKDGGQLGPILDMAVIVKNHVTARIQEAHLLAEHMLCQLVDHLLFQQHMKTDEAV
ncbi:MAG: D-sedoheptulose 7-phosphate isomerase [Deltaproteobacteria bacterium]